MDRNPDVNTAILTEQHYKELSAVLEDLIYGVGEAECDLQTALKLTKQQGHDSIKTNVEKRLRELNGAQ